MVFFEVTGLALIAYCFPLGLFFGFIIRDSLNIIVWMTSSFFYLIALLLSACIWLAMVPLREHLIFGVTFSVLIQEIVRFLFYLIMKKAQTGLFTLLDDLVKTNPQARAPLAETESINPNNVVAEPSSIAALQQKTKGSSLITNRHILALVSGLGFGSFATTFSIINILNGVSGSASVGIQGQSPYFAVVSAILACFLCILHTLWSIIFNDALESRRIYSRIRVYATLGLIVGSHLFFSCMTLFNQEDNVDYNTNILLNDEIPIFATPPYERSLTCGGVMVGMFSFYAYYVCGGRFSLKRRRD